MNLLKNDTFNTDQSTPRLVGQSPPVRSWLMDVAGPTETDRSAIRRCVITWPSRHDVRSFVCASEATRPGVRQRKNGRREKDGAGAEKPAR